MRPVSPPALAATLAGTALVLAQGAWAGAGAGAVEQPNVGHYEARAPGGAYLSFFVRNRPGGARVENLVAFRRCGGELDELGNVRSRPMPVDRGRFALPRRLQPLFNIRGTFTARARATVHVGPSFGCGSKATFLARRVNRRAVVAGTWAGIDASGAPLSFRVDRFGRAIDHFRINMDIRCERGAIAFGDAPLLAHPIPVLARRSFSVRETASDGGGLRALRGRFTTANEAEGSLRVVFETDGQTCDSGTLSWTATRAEAS